MGALDEQENAPVFENVRRLEDAMASAGNAAPEVHVIDRVGHGLIDHERHTLHEGFVRLLTRWLETRATRAGSGVSAS